MLYNTKQNFGYKLYFEPIKITSPEQFVPLYLIQESPVVPDTYFRSSDSFMTYHADRSALHKFSKSTPDIDYIKETLVSQLNHSYPSEYRFSIDLNSNYYCRDLTSVTLNKTFLQGDRTYVTITDGCVGLGLAVSGVKYLVYNTLKTGSLYDNMKVYYKEVRDIKAGIIILIKAKLIPELRARFYLQLPIILNLGDMKVLRNSSLTDLQYVIDRLPEVRDFLNTMNPIVEYVDNKTMLSYLFPPFNNNVTKKQYIKNVLDLVTEHVDEELEESLNAN